MQTTRVIGLVSCAIVLAACNDAPKSNEAAQASASAVLASRQDTATNDALPQAVPVPPASASGVVTGAIDPPAASSETPVAFAKADTSTPGSAMTDSTTPAASAAPESTPSASSNSSADAKAGTDSAATDPLGTLSPQEQSTSMPMAGHGNNHSSPSLEQGARK